jgi:hypothetical protein
LQASYPEYQNVWQQYTPHNHISITSQRDFFDQLAAKWGIRKPEDWLEVTSAMVLKEDKMNFVNNHYNGSFVRGIPLFEQHNISSFISYLSRTPTHLATVY